MTLYLDLDRWNYAFDRARNLPRFLRRAARETGDPVLAALGTLADPRSAMDALEKWVEEDWDAVGVNTEPLCTATTDEMAYRALYVDARLASLWAALSKVTQ